ncbi:MAG: 3-isopropylmalate dehydratase small subunit [Promethearchaeota archaeon]
MDLTITGKIIKYSRDNINTDEIIPARYLNTSDPDELASHCMEDLDASFLEKKKGADVIVAGRNFGCGSSREHAPIAIKASGIKAVVAPSFARIFFRNAINIGLPIFESGDVEKMSDGDEIQIDAGGGSIRNVTRNEEYEIVPFPTFLQDLVSAGGLVNYARQKIQND